MPEYGEDAPRRAVGSVSVARVARIDDSHALVTVAAAATGGTQYLAVPVARDARGGLVVSDLPSLAAPPARRRCRRRRRSRCRRVSAAPIEDVVSRFLRAYLGGDAGALSFYVPAGVRIGALGQRHELVDVTSLALLAPAKGRVREVLATVRAKDAATGATYGLRYRLRLVREDRWLVAAVNLEREGGCEVMRKFVMAATVTVCTWAVAASAWAAGDGEKVGENIGNLLGGWAKSLYVGIAAVVALMFLLNRRFADLAVFMVAALIVGGFVMAPNDVAGTIRDIWTTITG